MIHFEIVTPEKIVYQDRVDEITIDTQNGEITILPKHTPLVSVLRPGEMRLVKDGQEIFMAVSCGFVEVQPDSKVIIVADAADRAEEIDQQKAEDARKRAEEIIANKTEKSEIVEAQASLAHALAQLKVIRRRKKSH